MESISAETGSRFGVFHGPARRTRLGSFWHPGRRVAVLVGVLGVWATAALAAGDDQPEVRKWPPLALHPENPRYFLFRGEPQVIVTSGEHYGALLNLDFDYVEYFETLAAEGLDNTRTFSGAYVETSGNFNIARNTLDPAAGRFICPWARSETPGYADGGNKFDLERFDPAYFARLRSLVSEASRRGIIVEMNLFCPFYGDAQWSVSPMNARNNINGIGKVGREKVYTLDGEAALLRVQEAMVRRIVAELRDFDNLYYEICNEPYFGGVTQDWHDHITDVVVEAEKDFARRHLISWNVANGSKKVVDPHPAISIFNFHYATPPDTVALNAHLGRPIGDNETGFRGTSDAVYRMEAWDFLLAGGALFNHLDYSFTAEHPDGSWTEYPPTQPGGGSPALRRQLGFLQRFVEELDFLHMRADGESLAKVEPSSASGRAFVKPDEDWVVYIRREGPRGPWSARWTGFLVPETSGEHSFHTVSNDGVRLWIDGKKLIDEWTDHAAKEDSAKSSLVAGQRYRLRLEYFYNGGQGEIRLRWTPPGGEKTTLPANALVDPEGRGAKLRGEYFQGRDLRQRWRVREDGPIDFLWGTESPFVEEDQRRETAVTLRLPNGRYELEWIHPSRSERAPGEPFSHGGGGRRFVAPRFEDDIALRVRSVR